MRRYILASTLLLIGCGTDTSNSFSGSFRTLDPSRPVVAQVNLVGEVSGANVKMVGEDGSVLAQATTTSSGVAFLHPLIPPENFTIVAGLPGSTQELRLEVLNYGADPKVARVNLLTTLAGRYFRSHPGISLREAEARVKSAAKIPGALDLEVGLNEPNPFFSDLTFLRFASEHGGVEALMSDVLAEAESSQGRFYRFSHDQASRPLSNLNGLESLANIQRLTLAQRLNIPDNPNSQLRFLPSISLIDAPTSLGGQFLLGLGTGVGGNLVTDMLGWGVQAMGLNFGTGGQLKEIADQLNQLTQLVEAMDAQITDNNLKVSAQALKDEYSPVRTASTDLNTQENSATITNLPFSPPTTFGDLINSINAPPYTVILDDSNSKLVGPGQMLMQGQAIVVNQLHGLDRPDSMLNWPWRANSMLNQLYPLYGYFSGQQTLALNLFAEQSHNFLNFANPVDGFEHLQPFFRSAVSSLKRQRQQLPLFTSDPNVLVDYENGIMWYSVMQDAQTFSDAKTYADGLKVQLALPDGTTVTYDNWRFPTSSEFQSLQNRGHYSPSKDSSVPTTSNNSTPGLPGLGFTNVTSALQSAPNDNGKNGDLWMTVASQENDQILFYSEYEFRLNHTDENNHLENHSSDKNAYLLCRTLGDQPVLPLLDGTPTNPTVPSELGSPTLTAGECAQFGVPTAITLASQAAPASVTYPDPNDPGHTKQQPVPANSLEVVASVTYQVNLGGSFKYGYNDTKTQNNPTVSHSGTVSSASNSAAGLNQLRDLIDWNSSAPNAFSLLNLPYIGGLGVPLQRSASNVTATILGAGGTAIQGKLELTPTTLSPHTLTSIQIVPRNQIYGSNNSQPAHGSYPYYCTGFYADGTLEALASQVTWTVTPNPNGANAQIVINGNGASLELNQPSQATPVPYNVTISASFNGKTDSTLAQIVPPVSP